MNKLDMLFDPVRGVHDWFAHHFWDRRVCEDLIWLLENREEFARFTAKYPFYLSPDSHELIALREACRRAGYSPVGTDGPALVGFAGVRKGSYE